MQYAVPQFIDAEDKLIGPFSLKQFGIVFGAAIFDVLLYKLLGFGIIMIVIGLPVALAGLAIAFVPFNGRQLYQMIPLFVSFFTKPKVYIFQHRAPSIESMHLQKAPKETPVQVAATSLESPQSALKRLSMALEQKRAEESDLIGAHVRSTNGK